MRWSGRAATVRVAHRSAVATVLAAFTLTACHAAAGQAAAWVPLDDAPSGPGAHALMASDDAKTVLAAWLNGDAVQVATRPRGGTWGATTILDSGPKVYGPRLASDPAGDATLVWGDLVQVHAATRAPGGDFVPVAAPLSTDGTYPSVAMSTAGDTLAAWTAPNGIEAAERLPGGSFAPLAIPQGGFGGNAPVAAFAPDGSAMVVWNDKLGTQTRLVGSYRGAGQGQSFGAPVTFASVTAAPAGQCNSFGEAAVAFDAQGDATVAWTRYVNKPDCASPLDTTYLEARWRAAGQAGTLTPASPQPIDH